MSGGKGWRGFFWSLFKRSRNAAALIDENRITVEVNGAFLRLVGRKRSEVVGHPITDVIAGGPRLTLREWRAVVQRGEWTANADIVRGDGRLAAVEYAAHPEVVTGRRLVLVVVLHTHRGGRRYRHTTGEPGPAAPLTEREREVVHLVALGMTSAEIADELHIALNTVRTHVRNAMVKVNARSRSHLVAVSLGEGHLTDPGAAK
ncbi:MAG: LuxR C-terminal-related transcriptional regulator [Gaiellaceae bacterium]